MNRKKTHEEFMKEMEEKGNPNVKVIGVYKNTKTKIECECKNNSDHHWMAWPGNLCKGEGCPYCSGRYACPENDVYHNRPDLLKYFENEEDAKRYTVFSSQKVELICPECGNKKKMKISKLSEYGFYCDVCNDGVSFPNKAIRNLLEDKSVLPQLDGKKIEWYPKWEKRVFFDSVIFIKDKIICIEMQGNQHKTGKWKNTEVPSIKERDEYKRKKCKELGIIEIEIDCEDTDFECIKKKILESELTYYINLSCVDWDMVFKKSLSSLVVKVCNIYNTTLKGVTEIAKELDLNRGTVIKYLQMGAKANICIYTIKDSYFRGIIYKSKYKYDIWYKGEFLGTFITTDLAVQFLNKKFPNEHFYHNKVNRRGERGNEINGLKIITGTLTEEDKQNYLKEYQKEHNTLS